MYKIGDVDVLITEESISKINEVTHRQVEDGNISDNVKAESDGIYLTGVVASNAQEAYAKLSDYHKKGDIINYVGKNHYTDVVIESFETDFNSGLGDGFEFSITLKQIRIARTRLVPENVDEEIKSQVKENTNAGLRLLQHVKNISEVVYNVYRD